MAARRRDGRMSKSWLGMAVVTANRVITATQSAVSSGIALPEGAEDSTILRVRGEILVVGVPNAATDVDTIGLGLIVVQTNAFTVGGTSLPGPIDQAGADWMWHRYVHLDAVTLTAGDPQAITVNERIIVDSKAMRRFPQGTTVAFVGEATTGDFASVEVRAV